MKKIAATLTLAIGIMVLFLTNVQANNPTRLSAEVMTDQSEVSMESKIVVQDWMLSFEEQQMISEKVTEKRISLESWMINANWNDNTDLVVNEEDIQLEDWMTRSFAPKIRILALSAPLM